MASLFGLLCGGGGVKFNANGKYAKDMALFNSNTNSSSKQANTTSQPDNSESSFTPTLCKELDFFRSESTTNNNSNNNNKKTNKRKHGDDHQQDQNDHEDNDNDDVNEDDDEDDDDDNDIEFANEEEIALFRSHNKIKVTGSDIPPPLPSLSSLLHPKESSTSTSSKTIKAYLSRNIMAMNIKKLTPIQAQCIPLALAGRELLGVAPTGSGKTLAFLIPLLIELGNPSKDGIRGLIIVPTRELGMQIQRDIESLTKGKPFKSCLLSKSHNASSESMATQLNKFDIIISTPLRLGSALNDGFIKLDTVRHLILDEADKLLEQGFLDQIDDILVGCTSPTLHRSLFSATMPSGIETLARTFLKDPIRVIIGVSNTATDSISQKLVYVGSESGKLIEIRQMIQRGDLKPPALIFVQSVERAQELFHELVYDGIHVDVIHSGRTKAQRDLIIQSFRSGKTWVLISTELMARGIDFKGVSLVINYDFPQSVASYIHRIGRTGRAGRQGTAITFFTKEDAGYLKLVVNVMKESGCDVPEWMLNLKNPNKKERKKLKRQAIERDGINTMAKYDAEKIKRKRECVEASKKRKAAILQQ